MAERYDFYVHDNRKITFNLTEPIMREDSGVTDFVFHIPKILNELEVSDWQWWLVFVNAKKEKYSIALTLSDDPESPLEKNVATYTVDYAMSIKAGSVQFALEAINAGIGGAIDNEWHTLTYETKVKETLQGNQAEYAETESDIISALLEEVRIKMNQVIGGATPTPVTSVSVMTDTSKLYLLTTDGEWYYYNGSAWVSGGVYGAGVVDSTPTQGSTNAVSSGGVYSALAGKVDAETGKGLSTNDYSDAEKAKVDEIGDLKDSIGELIPPEIVPDVVGYIKTNVSPVDINNPMIPSSGGWRYKLVACQEGDEFTVYGRYLGTAADLYTFVDAEYNVLDRSVDKSTNDTYYPVAPANSAYVIFQKNASIQNQFWKGIAIDKKIESISNAVDNIETEISGLSPIFAQNIEGWKNQGIAPSTGAVSANAKRLKATIPYTALSCYVDSGYSFLVFGWDGDTYLGWWDGTAWSKDAMVLRTTELDLTSISNKTLYAILVHGTTTAGAVNINADESVHFYIKCKTDSQLNTKNVPADAYATGQNLNAVKDSTTATIKTITSNEVIVPDVSGYITTNVSPVDVASITVSSSIYYGVYPCEPLEFFTVKGSSPGSVAGYCVFVDAEYNVLKREGQHAKNTVIQAPENSAYVIFQQNINNPNFFIRGKLIADTVDELVEQMDNIDNLISGYRSTSYYASDDKQNVVTNYDTLISMYDALVADNPNYITKNTLTYNSFSNYEYVFSMGDRNGGNGQRAKDTATEKPVVLITAGTHGHERCSIMGLYLFAKALCESPELSALRNGLTIKMIPVVCPSGYNANTRVNTNGVNINRNFDGNWQLTPDDGMNYSGASAADQDETQVVQAWMNANTDAVIGIDWHNSAFTNEVCYFATCISTGFAVDAKKGYFYGLDHIISHWINDRDIAGSDVIYGYVGTDSAPGTSYAYAKTIDLNWCLFETSWDVGTYGKDTAETIGVNAEAFCALMKGVLEKYINQI